MKHSNGLSSRPASRSALMLLAGALVGALALLGVALWPRPRPLDATVLPQDTTVRLALRSDGPRGEFSLDQPAPDFALTYADGTMRRLSDLRGKPIVLNFWATWCTPCKAEMPELQALYREGGEGASFELLAVNVREAPEPAAAYAAELGLTFPILIDPSGALPDSFRVTVMPTTYLIDTQGVVREQHLGPLSRGQLRELLADLP